MSRNLRELILPALVEQRRREEQQQLDTLEHQQVAPYTQQHRFSSGSVGDGDVTTTTVYTTANSSSSDITSPVTPTFSPTRGHTRFSSSTSSLELPSLAFDSPSSPTQTAQKAGVRQLPDVQEEPTERDDDDTILADQFGLYSCLCSDDCQHRDSVDDVDALSFEYDVDYDIGFLSDGDYTTSPRYPRKRRNGSDFPFSGMTSRIGTRFPGLIKWKSGKSLRMKPIASPTCELTFENAYAVSRAASSRSSSLSAPGPGPFDRISEPSVPMTPELSFWESTESVNAPGPIDIGKANNDRLSLERDRAMATTPLLPPLMTEGLERPSQRSSPLQSPTVAGATVGPDTHSHQPTPSLSTKPSLSSFRHVSTNPLSPEIPMQIPTLVQEHDEWSDRLGHANFNISPQPYRPDAPTMEALQSLRVDWDAARVNYTKHLVRTGENYGQTSKIYALTEAKWTEIEQAWRVSHEETMERIVASSNATIDHNSRSSAGTKSGSARSSRSRSRGRGRGRAGSGSAAILGRSANDETFAGLEWRRLEEDMSASAFVRMLDAEGKFPARGDEDIVGPMARDEVMIRARSEDRKGAKFWRNLVDKVGRRK